MIPHIQTTDIQQQTSQHPSLCFVTSPLFGFSSLSILALSLYYYFSSISISSLTFFFSSFSFFYFFVLSISSFSSIYPLSRFLSSLSSLSPLSLSSFSSVSFFLLRLFQSLPSFSPSLPCPPYHHTQSLQHQHTTTFCHFSSMCALVLVYPTTTPEPATAPPSV